MEMKLSYTTMATPGRSTKEAVKLARLYGYQGIDMRVSSHLGELTENITPKDASDIRLLLDGEGIKLAGLLCYNKTGDDEPSSWQIMKDSIRHHLEIALMTGAKNVRIFSGNIV